MSSKENASNSSLQRLLALDKTFDTLEQRIEEAARILSIDLGKERDGLVARTERSRSSTVGNYGRHEFVLRWILEKLKKLPETRSTIAAWSLAWHVVRDMPLASCARVVLGSQIMVSITEALTEHFPAESLEMALEPQTLQTNGVSEIETDNAKERKKSKKRKRADKEVDEASSGATKSHPSVDEKLELFANIAALTHALVEHTTIDGSRHQTVLQHQMQSVLRLEGEKRMLFMRHWLYALVYIAGRQTTTSASSPDLPFAISLSLQVWDLQPSAAASERDGLVRLFCQQCEWPLFLLLSMLKSQPRNDMDDQESVQKQPIASAIRRLEQLFAQQILMPARAAMAGSAGEDLASNGSGGSENVEECLRPITDGSNALKTSLSSNSAMQQCFDVAYDGLSNILETAVRAVRLDSPKRRQQELPWIEAVFKTLHPLSGRQRTGSTKETDTLFISNNALVQMLDGLSKRGLSLGSGILGTVIDQHCHLGLQDDPSDQTTAEMPDFAVISQLVKMNATIFAASSAGLSNKIDALLEELTKHAQIDCGVGQKLKEQREAMIPVWRDEIVIPLMRSFARTRNLTTFILKWRQHTGNSPETVRVWSLWTDQTLSNALGQVLETAMTTDQIRDLLRELSSPLREAIDSCNKYDGSGPRALSRLYATFALLHAVVGAIKSDLLIQSLEKEFFDMHDACSLIVRCFEKDFLFAGRCLELLWPCLILMHERKFSPWALREGLSSATDQVTFQKEAGVIDVALKIINTSEGDHTEREALSDRNRSAALRYIVYCCDVYRSIPGNERHIELNLVALLSKGSAYPAKNDDVLSELDKCSAGSPAARKPRIVASVLSRYPQVWAMLPSAVRDDFLGRLMAATQDSPETAHAENNAKACKGLVSAILFGCTKDTRNQLCESLLSHASAEPDHVNLIVDVFLKLWPVAALSSGQAEKLVDLASEAIKNSATEEGSSGRRSSSTGYLSLLVMVSGVPCGKPQIVSNADSLWNLASSLDNWCVMSNEAPCTIFSQVCRNVFAQVAKQQSDEAILLYVETLAGKLYKSVKNIHENGNAILVLISTFIAAVESDFTDKVKRPLPHEKPKCISKLAQVLLAVFVYDSKTDSLADEGISDTQRSAGKMDLNCKFAPYVALHEIPASYWAKTEHESSGAFFERCNDLVSKAPAKLASGGVFSWVLSNIEASNSMMAPILKPLALFLGQDNNPRSYAQAQDAFGRACSHMDAQEKIALLAPLMDDDMMAHPEAVVLMRSIIASMNRQQLVSAKILPTVMELSAAFFDRLQDEADFKMHHALIQCITTILREKPFLINQYGVESILSCVNRLVSPTSPPLPARYASAIYLELCSMMQALFQFHRSSLGGRIHLIVPILTQLIGCLFTPHKGSPNSRIFRHPSWLEVTQRPLGPRHAQRFARLLTLLCNPPQSTVSGYRSRGPELVDETRKVRNYVSQHVQYILHAFCRMLLHGRLGEGMRDALTPGLWAIIDVMDLGAGEERRIKVLGASMNKQELALLRREYENWKRFGAWKG